MTYNQIKYYSGTSYSYTEDMVYKVTGCKSSEKEIEIFSEYKGCPVTSIAEYAFENCEELEIIDIPSSVKIIGEGAFKDCSNLVKIDIPNSVLTIDKNAFINCSSLTEVIIPISVKELGEDIFSGCSSLQSIEAIG